MTTEHIISIDLLRNMKEPLTPEEKKRHSIWINQDDVRFTARYDDRFGEARVSARYEKYAVFKDPRIITFLLPEEYLRDSQSSDVIFDMKIESLQAIQRSIEDNVVNGMLQNSYDKEAYIPYRDMYIPHKAGYYKFQAKYFPTVGIQKHEVLVLMSQEMYHRMMFNKPPKEIPEALIGKIEWIEGRL